MTSAVGNVDYWISVQQPQAGQNDLRVFNVSTSGVISADNYLGEPNCTSQESCITYRIATGIKGDSSGSSHAPFATYSIPIGMPNSGPIHFPTDGTPWGIRLTGPGADGSYILSWQSGRAKVGTNPQLFADPQYLKFHNLVGRASVSFSSSSGQSLAQPSLTLEGNVYNYIRALDSTRAENQGYSYLSPYLSHVIIPSSALTPGTRYYYTVSTNINGTWINSSEKGPFSPLPTSPTFPLTIGLMSDNGQTVNSSLTATRMADMNLQAIIHPGDYSYADNYAANDPNSIITGTGSGGHNDNRHDSFHAMWEKVLSKTPELHCAGNHEIESQQCANVDSKGNIIGNSTCKITPNTTSFSFPSNWPFQAYTYRYPVPGSTLDNIGDINKNMYYSTTIGGLIMLITLNNYIPFHPGTPQYSWAFSAFTAYDRSVTPWLIVQFHAPIYHSYFVHYKEQECFSSVYEPLFYQYGVDLVLSGHVHAYERSHSMYNYRRDDCGAMHIVVGDAGNVEGPYRSFIDDIFPYTNTTYCEILRGAGSGICSTTTSFAGGLYATPNCLPNNATAVEANTYAPSYQMASQPSWCPTMSFQEASGTAGGPVKLPYAGPFNVSALNDTRNVFDPSKTYGFCQTSQPSWSAYRDPSFGFATLTFTSRDEAVLMWYRNIDPPGQAADSVTIRRNRDTCLNARSIKSPSPSSSTTSSSSTSIILGLIAALFIILLIASVVIWLVPLFKKQTMMARKGSDYVEETKALISKDLELQPHGTSL